MKQKQCMSCGAMGMKHFSGEAFTLGHAGHSTTVEDLAGWRCPACGEVVFDDESTLHYANASDGLVLRERARQRTELARARKRLKLTQAQAAALTGGGHNAFSRYERGEAKPSLAVLNLFRLLGKHPELLDEVRAR